MHEGPIIVKGDGYIQTCPRCGVYQISGTSLAILGLRRNQDMDLARVKISGWIQDRNATGEKPADLSSTIIDSLLERPLPPVAERAERILRHLGRETTRLNQDHDTHSDIQLEAISYSASIDEAHYLVSACRSQGWLDGEATLDGGGWFVITPAGHAHLDALTATYSSGDQAFIAMWFSSELNDAYNNGIHPAVENAGYRPVRIDRTEHANKIDDEIIGQIRKSRFLVADFTGHRGGVYFEAGFAMGLNIPVIWTCRQDHMANLHFDIRQYNCIAWENSEQLKLSLQRRVEAVIGVKK